MEEDGGVGARALKDSGVDAGSVRTAIESHAPKGTAPLAPGLLPFSPRAKQALAFAMEESRRPGHDYIGTEHLLLGLLCDDASTAARIVGSLTTLEELRSNTLQWLGVACENALMEPNQTLHIDYVELPATDLEAMQSFYGAAFGWEFQSWGPEYVSFSQAGVEGGFRKEDAPPPRGGALVVLVAGDLNAAERAVVDAGGEIVARHEFPGGRRFHFLDPSGNELAVWTKA